MPAAAPFPPAPPPTDRGHTPRRAGLRDWRELSADERIRWDELARQASEPNPFFESWYLLPSLDALASDGAVRLFVLEAGGQWLGVLPIAAPTAYYGRPLPHWASWVHANTFVGAPLVAAGHEAEFWQALLDTLDAAPGRGLFLHLAGQPLGGPVHDGLMAAVETQRRRHGLVWREERAMLASSLSPEGYLDAALPGKKRKELRRQFARLSEQGVLAVERHADADALDSWITAFLNLEAGGWKGRAGSALASSAATASLFREALTGAAARGRLERLALTLDGAPVAMLATFLAPPGAFAFKTAFDERLARFSPGVLLQRENLALLEREGIAWCDSCAAPDHPMIDHFWRERRAIGRWSIALGGPIRRAAFAGLLAAEMGRRPAGVSA